MRMPMMGKRMSKLDLIARTIPADQQFTLHGPADAELTVVSWGSPKGTILDAMKLLETGGLKINFVQCRLMKPFPADPIEALLRRAKRLVLVEENYTGQLGSLIAEHTGVRIEQRILKYDGRPLSEDEMGRALRTCTPAGRWRRW